MCTILKFIGASITRQQWRLLIVAGTLMIHDPLCGQPDESAAPGSTSVDRNGDELPGSARARLGSLRYVHSRPISSVAFFPDNKKVATASGTLIRIFDVATGKQLQSLEGKNGSFIVVQISPDGNYLAASASDCSVVIWDMSRGGEKARIDNKKSSGCIAFSPDSKLLAVGACKGALVSLWHAETGKLVRELRYLDESTPDGTTLCLAFSPDGKYLIAGYDDIRQALHMWEVSTGKRVERDSFLQDCHVRAVAFSHDGKFLALTDGEKIRYLETATGDTYNELRPESNENIEFLAFLRDGKTLACAVRGPGVFFFDVTASCGVLRQWGWPAGYYENNRHEKPLAFALSRDGNTIAGTDYDLLHLWDTGTGKLRRPVGGHEREIRSVCFTSDGKRLVSGSSDRTIRIWDAQTCKELQRLEHSRSVWALALSPDGRTLASTTGGPVLLWNLETGKEIRRFNRSGTTFGLAFAPDGKTLAAGQELWDVEKGDSSISFDRTSQDQAPLAIGFAPDGNSLAYISIRGEGVFIADAKSGDPVTAYLPPRAHWTVSALCYSADGQTLAVLEAEADDGARPSVEGRRGFVRLWDLTTGIWSREYPKQVRVMDLPLAFSPDNRVVALGSEDGVVYILEAATGKLRRLFTGHLRQVSSLCFAPDGLRLASASHDTTILVWEVYSGAKRAALDDSTMEKHWNALAADDATEAYESMCALLDTPQDVVPFLSNRLQPSTEEECCTRRILQLISKLDDDSFEEREKAVEDLIGIGKTAEGHLRLMWKINSSPEVRDRIKRILKTLVRQTYSPRQLRALRAVEVLERIGSSKALNELAKLAEQPSHVRYEVKASVQRLRKQANNSEKKHD